MHVSYVLLALVHILRVVTQDFLYVSEAPNLTLHRLDFGPILLKQLQFVLLPYLINKF